MSDRAHEDSVDEVILRLSGLEFTVKRIEPGSDYGFEVVNREPVGLPS